MKQYLTLCLTVWACLVSVKLMAAETPGEAAYQKGLKLYGEKKFLLAVGSFKSAVEAGYQDARLYFYLGNAYVQNDDYPKARDQFRLAFEAAEKPAFQGVIAHNLGYVYYLEKDYPKAIDWFSRSSQLNPALTQAWWYKGMAYFRQKDRTNTIAEWEAYVSVVTNGPQSDNIRKALAILKADGFRFEGNKVLETLGQGDKTTNQAGTGSDGNVAASPAKPVTPEVTSLIDIEGVLDEVKPADKGKVSDQNLEEIEQ